MLIKTTIPQKAASCPNWNRESTRTAQLVVSSAKALQQEINGSRLATSSPCLSTNESQVLMAVSRLVRRAVQHSISDTVTEEVPAKPAHIRFAASAHEEWYECQDHQECKAHKPNEPITTEETGSYHSHSGHEVKEDEEADIWHDCHQQRWSAAQHIRQARYPSMTNSEARRQQRKSALTHKLASAMQAAAELDAEQSEIDKQEAKAQQAHSSDDNTNSEGEDETSDDDTSDDDSSDDEQDIKTSAQVKVLG